MAEPAVIGPQDAQLALQASVTKTATFNSTGLDLGSGFAPAGGGMPMIRRRAVQRRRLHHRRRDLHVQAPGLPGQLDLDGPQPGGVVGRVASGASGVLTVGAFIQQRYVRLVMTAAGTTPSITYQGYLNPFTND
jgi:hypothetical protein